MILIGLHLINAVFKTRQGIRKAQPEISESRTEIERNLQSLEEGKLDDQFSIARDYIRIENHHQLFVGKDYILQNKQTRANIETLLSFAPKDHFPKAPS